MFASGPGSRSAFRTSQLPESAANQLKGCRSNQMHCETKPASAVRLFTSQFNSTKCAAADILRALCTAAAAFGDYGRTQVEECQPKSPSPPAWNRPSQRVFTDYKNKGWASTRRRIGQPLGDAVICLKRCRLCFQSQRRRAARWTGNGVQSTGKFGESTAQISERSANVTCRYRLRSVAVSCSRLVDGIDGHPIPAS